MMTFAELEKMVDERISWINQYLLDSPNSALANLYECKGFIQAMCMVIEQDATPLYIKLEAVINKLVIPNKFRRKG